MRRFFVDNRGAVGETLQLPESESRHISRALRLGIGTVVELLDGSGLVYSAELVEVGRQVLARITAVRSEKTKEAVVLYIGQGQLKGQKMDTVIQKCTELGVSRVMPFWSSRCQGKLQELQGEKKLERYKRIVESACKQCYRSDLMVVDPPCTFTDLLQAFPIEEGRLRLLFWEEEREFSLHDLVIPEIVQEVVILLGPEGGLSIEEAEMAKALGWQTVSLGRRILRAETATITAASLVQFLVRNI